MTYHSSGQNHSEGHNHLWYLGIDWGTTKISAVLLDSSRRCFYPLEPLSPQPVKAGVSLKPWLDWGLPGVEGEWVVKGLAPLGQSIEESLVQMVGQLREMVEKNSCYQELWSQLSGVIVGCPAHWSDAYRFNLREAILRAGWVNQAHQIMFLEEAIALVISELRDTAQGNQWQGATLILDSGATSTEFALVDLPLKRSQLKYEHFHVASLAYGGDAIDQDIICQLLLSSENGLLPSSSPLEKRIKFPQPGEVDVTARHRLSEYLNGADWGEKLLEIAREIKHRLQIETQIAVRLDRQQWTIRRRDLEIKVFVPFLRGLNREINRLFTRTGVAPQAVRQMLCTGGSASLPAIARWLRQKLPSAAIIQDRTPQGQPPKCSRVAYGLANLPLYPQVLNSVRHQYSDYFLLLELLRVMPDGAIAETQLFQLLEQRGINTAVCGDRLHQLLSGYLPPGLRSPQKSRDFKFNQSLFIPQETGFYALNPEHKTKVSDGFEQVLATSSQTLDDPYLVLW
ncbi:hypothetical protein PJF56_17920 [Roseofilum sp. BLCC_M91]|uniref:Hsp70 family protein n=1 Tax=Roseofilum halophilum BLCC-M91 TaxID=3022259 RepID=A0ABT7BNS1_9CYAN|nr:hypothetical protein [Roseofilum halophilum]MDJ1180740.1 hypothetical protein [Roseofilum halophilum BLCC-M91]